MTTAKAKPSPAPVRATAPAMSKRKSGGTTILVRSRRAALAKMSGALAITVAPKTFMAVSKNSAFIKKLVESFGGAIARSRGTGRRERVVVDVEPSGMLKIVTKAADARAPAAEDQADASVTPKLETALQAARARGHGRVAEILAGPDMLSADQFAALLGTSRMTVNTWRRSHQVLALHGARRGFRFPDWQIGDDGKPFDALPSLFEKLGGSDWAMYRFLVQRHPELGDLTAREALRQGRTAAVLDAAENAGRAFG